MIRRSAALIGTGDAGFVLAWRVKIDSLGNETLAVDFEHTLAAVVGGNPGEVREYSVESIRFTDGSPSVIPMLS